MGGHTLPNVTFRLTKDNEKNNELYNNTITLYKEMIKNLVLDSEIEIILNYLKSWIDCVTQYPTMYYETSYTEFFTKTSFPSFVITATLQIS